MAAFDAWTTHRYALVHGDDGDGRKAAVEAWKLRHVDPEWADFSLTVCAEGCPWAEVQNALLESAPLGASRVVVVPQAENLLEKAKDLPTSIKGILAKPVDDTSLLLVSRSTLSAGPGRILGAKPFSDWAKEGRVFKAAGLEAAEVRAFLDQEASRLGIRLEASAAAMLQERLGGKPGVLRRALEVLELSAPGATIGTDLVDVITFRMDEQRAFAWSEAWQKGSLAQAMGALRQALEDDSGAAVGMVAQASRDVGRLATLAQALAQGITAEDELAKRVGMPPNQRFLIGRTYLPVARKVGLAGARRLVHLVHLVDRDVKGCALNGSASPLAALTFELWRAFRP